MKNDLVTIPFSGHTEVINGEIVLINDSFDNDYLLKDKK